MLIVINTNLESVLVVLKSSNSIDLRTRGTVAHSSVDKANALNNFFYDCYNQNCPPLTQCSHNYEQEMPPEDCPEQLLSTEASVLDLLAQLDTAKSTGCDGISARMLKQTADSTAPILSKLCQFLKANSLESGRQPGWSRFLSPAVRRIPQQGIDPFLSYLLHQKSLKDM